MKKLREEIKASNLSEFTKQCYLELLKVPPGKVTTYQDLAHKIGTKAYRAVGTAMKNNPYAPQVPCHRVVNSNGKIGQYAFGQKKKVALLKSEGVSMSNSNIVDLGKSRHAFRA